MRSRSVRFVVVTVFTCLLLPVAGLAIPPVTDPTTNLLSNAGFEQWETREETYLSCTSECQTETDIAPMPVDWHAKTVFAVQDPEVADAVHRVDDSHSGNYALEEGGPDWPAFIMGIYLYQRVQIKAGFSYQGSYWARNPSINDPFARRLGVLWLDAGGNPIDSFRVLPGESSEYSFHEGGGYAPCGAKLAEVRFDKADWGYIRYDDAYFALVEADPPIVCPDNGRLIKEYVIDHLQIVAADASDFVQRRISQAITHLLASLEPSLWESDSTLTEQGSFVFHHERMAVAMLMSVSSMEPTVVDDIVLLVRVDRALAQTAVDEARAAGGAPDLIRVAEEKLAEGDELAASEKYSMAISRYGQGWVLAETAIAQATAAPSPADVDLETD